MAYIIERLIIALLAFLASIAGEVQEQGRPELTAAVVIETTQTQHTQSVGSVETAPQWQNCFRQYRVNGVLPPYEWQWYLYGRLADRGLEWWYPYAVCQIYQESNWNQWSTNGRDHGLTQQNGMYWPERSAQAGIPSADIWDVNAQIHVYVWQMAQYLAAAGYDTGMALSMYYTGADVWSEEYVNHVMRWMDYLEVVE